jgi:hypothetical protein
MIEATKANKDWNTEAEKTAVLEAFGRAREIYVNLQK